MNDIPPSAERYKDMCVLLDLFIKQDGCACAILYSTHQRSTADFLRGIDLSGAGDFLDSPLFYRYHKWMPIPRIVNEGCLLGLRKKESSDQEPVSFRCAVLRGRIPTLALLSHEAIRGYASYGTIFRDTLNREAERQRCLAAVITGSIEYHPKTRIFEPIRT